MPLTPSTLSGPATPTPLVTTSPQPTPMSTPTATDAPIPTTPTPAETTADISVQDNRLYFIRSASFLVGSVFFEKPESISFALISIWAPKENFCLFDQFLEQSELASGRYDLPEQTADDIFDKIDAGKFGDSFDLMKADLEMRAEIQYINGDSKTLTCKAESQMWYGIMLYADTGTAEFFEFDGGAHTLLIDQPDQVKQGIYSMTVLIDDQKVAAEDIQLDKEKLPAEIWDEAKGEFRKGTYETTIIKFNLPDGVKPDGSHTMTFIVYCWLSGYETVLDTTYTLKFE